MEAADLMVPSPLVGFLNARASASSLPVTVESIEFPGSDRLLVRCEARKFGLSARLSVTCRMELVQDELWLSEILSSPRRSVVAS